MGGTLSTVVSLPGLPFSKGVTHHAGSSDTFLERSNKPRSVIFRFLDLPPEVRCMIYEEALVVGKVFLQQRCHDQELYQETNSKRFISRHLYRTPQVQVLRLSKTVHREAEAIYLSKNLFVLPLDWHRIEPFISLRNSVTYDPQQQHLFSQAALTCLRNLSIAIDMIDISRCGSTSWHWRYEQQWSFEDLSPWERYRAAHDLTLSMAIRDGKGWDVVTSVFNCLQSHSPGLNYVEIDFTNALCPIGCCRPVGLVKFDWVHHLKPKTISILGVQDEVEQSRLLEMWKVCDNLDHDTLLTRHGLQFRERADSQWEEWLCPELPSKSLCGPPPVLNVPRGY